MFGSFQRKIDVSYVEWNRLLSQTDYTKREIFFALYNLGTIQILQSFPEVADVPSMCLFVNVMDADDERVSAGSVWLWIGPEGQLMEYSIP